MGTMKRIKKAVKRCLLPAVIAAAAAVSLLPGCSPAQSGVPESTAPAWTAPPKESAHVVWGDLPNENPAPAPEWSLAPAESAPAEGEEAPRAGRTLPEGDLERVGEDIPDEAGDGINRSVEEMEQQYRDDPMNPVVKKRDWSSYTSELAKKDLAPVEAEFYDRLDDLCWKYIVNDALDGVSYGGSSGYATGAARFNDLGLTKEQAGNVFWWFKYNNPQYYFLTGNYLISSKSLYPKLYDFLADAKERAEVTNELFDKLDGWIASVNDDEATTWQKELSANNLLCRNIVYNDDYEKNGGDRMGQTLYTAVIMESTVCGGYAQAFCAMMNALGIETVVALSEIHAWNVVRFDDGNYYAVDVTWNDNKDNDDEPYNGYFNAGEKTMKAGSEANAAHTYRDNTGPWTPVISRDNCSPTNRDASGTGAGLDAPAEVFMLDGEGTQTSWSAVPGATGYQVCVYKDSTYTEIAQIYTTADGSTQTNWVWANMKPGMSYYCGVRAVKAGPNGESYSDWHNFMVQYGVRPDTINP